MHESSFKKMSELFEQYLCSSEEGTRSVLDFGSYDVNGTYKNIFPSSKWDYKGIDLQEGPNVDYVFQNPYVWSGIKDNSIDLVVSGQALEHCEFPWLIFEETKRVLKCSGKCIFIAPSSGHEHKYPVDCWRIYPDGMKALCKHAGLEVLHCETDWNPKIYNDESHLWKDTSLVAENIK